MSDEQPTEEITTTTAETSSELTVGAEEPGVYVTAGAASIPAELLRGGGGATVTITTTVSVVITPPVEPAPAEAPPAAPRRYINRSA